MVNANRFSKNKFSTNLTLVIIDFLVVFSDLKNLVSFSMDQKFNRLNCIYIGKGMVIPYNLKVM